MKQYAYEMNRKQLQNPERRMAHQLLGEIEQAISGSCPAYRTPQNWAALLVDYLPSLGPILPTNHSITVE